MTQTAQTREALVELMAEAICDATNMNRVGRTEIEAANAALLALEAAGVRLAPDQPTAEMLEHAFGSINYTEPSPSEDAERVYSAMLSASPYAKDKP